MAKYIAILALTAAACLPTEGQAAAPAAARVDCQALENGKAGSGSFRVMQGETQIAKGSCGRPVEVAPSSYEMLVVLDGVVDAPVYQQRVEARAGQLSTVKASFETGELLVEVTREGRRGVASVKLLRGGRELATLSAGVASRVSVGTYTVQVESRADRRVLDAVTISRQERRVLSVDLSAPAPQASP